MFPKIGRLPIATQLYWTGTKLPITSPKTQKTVSIDCYSTGGAQNGCQTGVTQNAEKLASPTATPL